jgi:hypothetical protein
LFKQKSATVAEGNFVKKASSSADYEKWLAGSKSKCVKVEGEPLAFPNVPKSVATLADERLREMITSFDELVEEAKRQDASKEAQARDPS